ncbi:MAG: class II aldolase/adducin family protein, partial [Erysipelotrichia bacterium]|nr:class II aldolase/adducin family protein [Erysipelotrichia bacterium]
MDFQTIIINSGIEMTKRNLTIETWGNISVRDPNTGLIYMTPSGMDYSALKREDIVTLNPDGSVKEGSRIPSVEFMLHCLVYLNRPEINAILHTHPEDSSVFSMLRKSIPMVSDELAQAFGEEIRTAEYA